jgi:hypothetical protein
VVLEGGEGVFLGLGEYEFLFIFVGLVVDVDE